MKKLSILLIVLGLVAACSQQPTPEEPTVNTNVINVYTRDSSSGTREAFESITKLEDLSSKAVETSGNGDMASKVGNDVDGIGYVSLTTDFTANKLKAVKYNGVAATIDTVNNGSYTLARPFAFVTRASGDFDSADKEALVAAFVAFITESVEGMEAVAKAGGINDLTNAKPWAEVKKDHPIVDQDNSGIEIRTSGSTSVEKTLVAAIESFTPLAGNVKFVTNQTGSGDGYKRVLGEEKDGANAADIGFASRNFNDKETGVENGLVHDVYCLDAVVVVVNEANTTIDNLTQEQVVGIFSGTVETWDKAAQ